MILYSIAKNGNIKTWESWVQAINDNEAIIFIQTSSKLGGKLTLRKEIIKTGKNLGKKNETSVYEQACLEVLSKYKKKQDQGYTHIIPTTKGINNLNFPQPMLAISFEKIKNIKFPIAAQPKLDGHRAIVTKCNGKIIFYSRLGKIINSLKHLENEIEPHINEGEFFDGELYSDEVAFEKLTSLIKKNQNESVRIKYHIYDTVLNIPFSERCQLIFDRFKNLQYINTVETVILSSEKDIDVYFNKCISSGLEGIMLRVHNSIYEAGFRSKNLIKLKPSIDDEFEIINIIEGVDRRVNNGPTLKVPILKCKTKEGKEFEVTAPGNMYEKDAIWHNKENYINKLVTVKYSRLTSEDKPFHPVAIRIR